MLLWNTSLIMISEHGNRCPLTLVHLHCFFSLPALMGLSTRLTHSAHPPATTSWSCIRPGVKFKCVRALFQVLRGLRERSSSRRGRADLPSLPSQLRSGEENQKLGHRFHDSQSQRKVQRMRQETTTQQIKVHTT